jgi:hypothetical protein
VLAQRPRTETVGFSVYGSIDNTDFSTLLAERASFAAFGKVAGAAYPNNTADLDTVTGITFDLLGVDLSLVQSMTDAQRDNELLLFNPVRGEIASVGQVTALGGGRFNAKLLRKLYGTTKQNHFIDDNLWFIQRAAITPIENAMFLAGSTRYFKLQPFTSLESLDLVDITSFSYVFSAGPAMGSVTNLQLATTAGIAAGNTPDIRIVASWNSVTDQDIFLFEIGWKKSADS